MRKFVIASMLGCVVLAAGVRAHAADMAVKAPPPPPVTPEFNWTGGYVGGNLGADWGRTEVDPIFGVVFPVFTNLAGTEIVPAQLSTWPSAANTAASVIGGAQAGYNWQSGHLVYGVEGDFDGTGLREKSAVALSRTSIVFGITQSIAANFSTNIDWIGTVRGKVGYAWDRYLVYGTGGVAVAGTSLSTTYAEVQPAPPPTPGSTTDSQTILGWTIGAGGEWAIDKTWSFGVEYRHIGFGIHNYNIGFTDTALAPFVPPNAATLHISTDQVTARLNWHFWQ